MDLSNKVKYLEGQLASRDQDSALQRSETSQKEGLNKQIMELELKLAEVSKENEFLKEQRNSLMEEKDALKEENSQVTTRVDSLLSVT